MQNPESIKSPNFDNIDPRQCINAKLRRLHRLVNSAYQDKINHFDLRGSMLSILFMIGKIPKINQKQIADQLVLDASTMSRDIGYLIKKGWVTKNRGSDNRNASLALTTEGILLLEKVSPIWHELHQKIEHILGQFNIQQIDNISNAIHSNLIEIKS